MLIKHIALVSLGLLFSFCDVVKADSVAPASSIDSAYIVCPDNFSESVTLLKSFCNPQFVVAPAWQQLFKRYGVYLKVALLSDEEWLWSNNVFVFPFDLMVCIRKSYFESLTDQQQLNVIATCLGLAKKVCSVAAINIAKLEAESFAFGALAGVVARVIAQASYKKSIFIGVSMHVLWTLIRTWSGKIYAESLGEALGMEECCVE